MTDRSLLPPGRPEDVLNFVGDGSQLVVPLALGEPPTLIKTLEDNCERFTGVRIHQMDLLQSHRYPRRVRRPVAARLLLPGTGITPGVLGRHLRPGAQPLLRNAVDPAPGQAGPGVGPRRRTRTSTATSASAPTPTTPPPSSATPFFLEVSPEVPFTYGSNLIHHSQLVGWTKTDAGFPEHRQARTLRHRPGDRPGRRAGRRRLLHPGRHRLGARRTAGPCTATANSASTPR